MNGLAVGRGTASAWSREESIFVPMFDSVSPAGRPTNMFSELISTLRSSAIGWMATPCVDAST